MDLDLMWNSAGEALLLIMEWKRIAFLALGVVIGLVLGIIPGIGGLVGMAILLPFTFDMDPYTAFAFLLGMGAVTTTGDTIRQFCSVFRALRVRRQRCWTVSRWRNEGRRDERSARRTWPP